jgi:hypothetical protein
MQIKRKAIIFQADTFKYIDLPLRNSKHFILNAYVF